MGVSGPDFVPVKSAERTLEVLEALAASPRRLSLSDLGRQLGIPKSSLHGILRTMVGRGWVDVDPGGARFGIGLRALAVGAAYVDAVDSISLIDSVLDRLAAELSETVHLGRIDGHHIVYLAKRESTHPLRLFSAIGRRLPAHATALGKAILAGRGDPEVAALLPRPLAALTAHTITGLPDLLADLAATRRRGYAVDREENSDGIVCFAAALTGRSPVTDAISVSMPAVRTRPGTERTVADALGRAVAEIARSRRILAED